jgi:hypothetical protein
MVLLALFQSLGTVELVPLVMMICAAPDTRGKSTPSRSAIPMVRDNTTATGVAALVDIDVVIAKSPARRLDLLNANDVKET